MDTLVAGNTFNDSGIFITILVRLPPNVSQGILQNAWAAPQILHVFLLFRHNLGILQTLPSLTYTLMNTRCQRDPSVDARVQDRNVTIGPMSETELNDDEYRIVYLSGCAVGLSQTTHSGFVINRCATRKSAIVQQLRICRLFSRFGNRE